MKVIELRKLISPAAPVIVVPKSEITKYDLNDSRPNNTYLTDYNDAEITAVSCGITRSIGVPVIIIYCENAVKKSPCEGCRWNDNIPHEPCWNCTKGCESEPELDEEKKEDMWESNL